MALRGCGQESDEDHGWVKVSLGQAGDGYIRRQVVRQAGDGKWTVSGGMKNITDEVYRVEGQEFSSVGGIQTAYYGYPRTYTFGFDYSF